ncbi:hypothetical protein [Echinimonas agarilytica]|uniref:Uncharacterized protein n=1 Tax=Echinimonas agarilytica TaxID=1215918 RepID=A0AA41W7M8_9GAMM|nr:hypothetical protein [Echinimonas agarilytica]MCM2679784.1 hypothetical protein [Echinimonas agarilytica]
MNNKLIVAVATLLFSTTSFAMTEQQCADSIDRYVGLHQHISSEQSANAVPSFTLGITPSRLAQLRTEHGQCHTWQQLLTTLQQQHSAILDKTEAKTGLASPKR